MAGINNIDYSAWSNSKAVEYAKKADTDGVKGLQGKEIFNFARNVASSIDKEEIRELLGLSVSQTRASSRAAAGSRPSNPEFDRAVEYYNNSMSSRQRYEVTTDTYDNLTARLYKMEKAMDEAFQDCAAYQDIVIVPRWHYRFYPYIETRLINFDIDELRTTTSRDMASLHVLKDRIESVIEEANGVTEHTEPEKTHYDVDELAQKHLGMSYEEFAEKYHDELEFCKTVTYANLYTMTPTQAEVYAKAKAYAREMLETTINEAHTVNWDAGERKTEETLKATGDMFTISEFEYDGITEDGLNEIQSGIMYAAFEEALISKHQELDPSGVDDIRVEGEQNAPRKVIVNGTVLIFNPDGSVFDTAGRKIK